MSKSNLGLIHNSFETALANPSTTYVEFPVGEGILGLHIRWADATSSATITMESSNEPRSVVSGTSTTAGDWCTETLAIVGPTASAAGGSMTNVGNVGADRLRLKIVTAAVTKLKIRTNWKAE